MKHQVTAADCAVFRKKVREEEDSISTVAALYNLPWDKVHRHVIGNCDHDISQGAVDRSDALVRTPVSTEDCDKMRKLAKDEDTILDLSEELTWGYQTILAHVRGDCRHQDGNEDPIPHSVTRSSDVTIEECETIRDAYFDARQSLTEVAEELGIAPGTAERHVKFICGHEERPRGYREEASEG